MCGEEEVDVTRDLISKQIGCDIRSIKVMPIIAVCLIYQ